MTRNVIDAICDMAIEDALKAHAVEMAKHIEFLERVVVGLMKDNQDLRRHTEVQLKRHLCLLKGASKRIEALENKARSPNKDAIEMRKAASMLYARAKQLEGE